MGELKEDIKRTTLFVNDRRSERQQALLIKLNELMDNYLEEVDRKMSEETYTTSRDPGDETDARS